jgi:AraC-like DNA-binding protein
LISSLTLPIEAEVYGTAPGQAYLGLSLDVDPVLVSQLMLQMDAHDPAAAYARNPDILGATPITEHIRQGLARLVELTTNAMDRDILCEGIKREIFYEVLKGPQGGLLRNCVHKHNGANRIAPVVHFIEENFHRVLDIDTLSHVAQMSPSSLHEQFRAFTSLSPIQFVKNLRLHRARSLLLSGTKATDATYQVGYSSPSQFSREFKRFFGCSPKDILLNA